MSGTQRTYWCEYAWLPPGRVARAVRVSVRGSRVAGVEEDASGPGPDDVRLAGCTLPGLADVHSHAFHRALRSRTQAGHGTFWTWREQMYEVAGRLDPDAYRRLATAVYAELALAGVTSVGEFHYLHHQPDGRPYAEANAMAAALADAAAAAGLRLTLLDTCYLTGDIGRPVKSVQVRFSDGDAHRWAARADALYDQYEDDDHVVVGAAVHSVRAVPADQLPTVAGWANAHDAPLHVHLSEQPDENEACLAAYGRSPTAVLAEAGVLGPRTTAVHATHLSAADIAVLGSSSTGICVCPTTERDLADGIGPARALADAGSPLTLGSDSHAVVDLFEEARALELHERLATRRRGHWSAAGLLHAATAAGHAALGFPEAGMIAPGAWADLVSVRLDSVRTAGAGADAIAEAVVFAASASDVHHVISSGRQIVAGGRHVLGEVGPLLGSAVNRDSAVDTYSPLDEVS